MKNSELTDRHISDLLKINLEKLKGYKAKGWTALQLINERKFPKSFVDKNFHLV